MGPRSGPPERRVLRRVDVTAALVGLAVLGASMLDVRDGAVSGWEHRLFEMVNDLPDGLYPVLWPFQQLGALAVGPLVALVAVVLRRRSLALAAVVVTIAKLVSERVVKAIVSRTRPFTSIGPEITTRGDVAHHGESFVSGHVLLVTALAGIVTPYLGHRWQQIVPWAAVVVVAIARVYVGAHNPLDVVGGMGLGLAVAGTINLAVRVPERRSTS